MRSLDLGCGSRKTADTFGADLSRGSDADVIADLDHVHYPFAGNTFDRVVLNHVIEHLIDVPGAVAEIWRIAVDGGVLEGRTPHFSSSASYVDPTHRHHFAFRTFEFLARRDLRLGVLRRCLGVFYRLEDPDHTPDVARKFEQIDVRLTFNPLLRRLGIEWAANIYPELYEAFFAFILPARDIVFRLKAVKCVPQSLASSP